MPQLNSIRAARNPLSGPRHPTSNPNVVPVFGLFLLQRLGLTFAATLLLSSCVAAQMLGPQLPAPTVDPFGTIPPPNPLTQPTLTPGVLILLELEGRFAKAVAAGGGKAFADWFADDAVTLNNGRPAVLGRAFIAAQAVWDPKAYQLTWVPQGARMGPSNDMGFTWGHYEGHATDKNGQPVVTSGRYFTVWKKVAGGAWKVALDASADEPADSGECCTLPKP
jgi:ketosteroid isomerase-like protein